MRGLRTVLLVLAVTGLVACGRTGAPEATSGAKDPVVLSLPYDPETLDPHARDRLADFAVAVHFYEPLVKTDSEMRVYPALAERWTNPDLLTWKITLRKGVTFHDGRPFTAKDALYSIERVTRDKTLDLGVYLLDLAKAEAQGDTTLVLTTKRPVAVLLNKLSSIVMVPEGSTKEMLERSPVGTGPYRFLSYTKGQTVEMERNESYWGTKPALARVTLRLARGPAEALSDFVTGKSALAQCGSRATEKALAGRAGTRLVKRTGLFVKYLGFDVARKTNPFVNGGKANPFLSRRVREAISLAVNRRQLTERLTTFALPASQFVPSFVFGYDAALPELAYSVEEARKALAEAGYPTGFEVTLHTREILKETAGLVAEALAPAGLRVNVVSLPDPEFFAKATSEKERPAFFLSRYGCSTGDASDVLEAGFRTPDPAEQVGRSNIGGFSSPALDAGIEASAAELEPEARGALLSKLLADVRREMVWVPLYFDEDVYAVDSSLTFTPRADSYVLAWEIGRGR
ncbi:MAG: hypothetical protein JNK60_04545 [Acidobacteria bacterium]|nr:hypothetical protein [Acidobacteriota bacterium]